MLTEQWIEFGRLGMYRVSSLGRVQTKFVGMKNREAILGEWRDKKLKKSKTDQHGGYYLTFFYGNRQSRLHIFMWEMFKGPRKKGMVINHIDGDRENCAIDNLEEVTQKENIQNLIRRGNFKIGRPRIAYESAS